MIHRVHMEIIIINIISASFLLFVLGSIIYLRQKRKNLLKMLLDKDQKAEVNFFCK